MSLGVSRYRRALPPVQNVSRGLLLIPRGFVSLAGAQRHSHALAHSHRLWPSSPPSRSSTPRCLLRPSLLARCLTTQDSTPPHLETAVQHGNTPKSLTEKLASVPVRPHGPRESVLVKTATVYPTRRATFAEKNKRYLATRRQEWLTQRRARYTQDPQAPTDWRYILRLLSDYTPAHSPDYASKRTVDIVIPPEARHLLEPQGRGVIQLIADRSGCEAIFHEAEDPNGTNHVSVVGFDTCLEEATDELLQLDSRVKVVSRGGPADVQTSKEEETDLRGHIIALHHRPTFPVFSYNLSARADEIPRPATWTEESFQGYVERLVKGRMTTARVSKLYPTPDSHELVVISVLLDLFADPSMFPLITPQAFQMALAYMARSTHKTVWARRLVQSVVSRGFKMDLRSMHLLLEATTKDESLSDFQVLLEQLIRLHLNPTLWTWILFLRHIKAEDVKRYILFLMDKKGLLNVPDALRLVALEMAPHDAYRGAQLGLDGKSFLAQQTELYGPGWADTDTCNKIAHGLLLQDRSEMAVDVVLGSEVKGDDVMLNTFLTHALQKRDEQFAISTLELFHKQEWGPKVIPHESFELLMKLALKTEQPNMLSVVWRYASMQGESSFWMRRQAYFVIQKEHRALKVVGWMATPQTVAADSQPQPESSPEDDPALDPSGETAPPASTTTTTPPDTAARRAFVYSLFLTDQDTTNKHRVYPPRLPNRPDEALTKRIAFYRKKFESPALTPLHPLHVKLEEAYQRDQALRLAVKEAADEGRPVDAAALRLVDVEVPWKLWKQKLRKRKLRKRKLRKPKHREPVHRKPVHPLYVKLKEAYQRAQELRQAIREAVDEGRPADAAALKRAKGRLYLATLGLRRKVDRRAASDADAKHRKPVHPLPVKLKKAYQRGQQLRRAIRKAVNEGRPADAAALRLASRRLYLVTLGLRPKEKLLGRRAASDAPHRTRRIGRGNIGSGEVECRAGTEEVDE